MLAKFTLVTFSLSKVLCFEQSHVKAETSLEMPALIRDLLVLLIFVDKPT
jgi:hypothetical protein